MASIRGEYEAEETLRNRDSLTLYLNSDSRPPQRPGRFFHPSTMSNYASTLRSKTATLCLDIITYASSFNIIFSKSSVSLDTHQSTIPT
jgi:hypothetical protein